MQIPGYSHVNTDNDVKAEQNCINPPLPCLKHHRQTGAICISDINKTQILFYSKTLKTCVCSRARTHLNYSWYISPLFHGRVNLLSVLCLRPKRRPNSFKTSSNQNVEKESGCCLDWGCGASSTRIYFDMMETWETAGFMQGVTFKGVDRSAMQLIIWMWLVN